MNSRRSEIEIIRDILSLSRDGAKKTQILYGTNLSYTQLQEYLTFLIKSGALEVLNSSDSRLYKTTNKGIEILEDINRLMRNLSISIMRSKD